MVAAPPPKVPKKHLLVFLAFVQDGARTSLELSERISRINDRIATPEQHELIVRILEYAIKKGFVSARTGVARGKVVLYIDLILTKRGEAFLERSKHRFWFLSGLYQQLKEFAAMIIGNILKP